MIMIPFDGVYRHKIEYKLSFVLKKNKRNKWKKNRRK